MWVDEYQYGERVGRNEMRWRVGLRETLVQKQRGKVLCALTLRQVGTDRHQQTDRLADWQELTWRISRSLPSTSAAQCSSLFRLCCLATRALDSRLSPHPLPAQEARCLSAFIAKPPPATFIVCSTCAPSRAVGDARLSLVHFYLKLSLFLALRPS